MNHPSAKSFPRRATYVHGSGAFVLGGRRKRRVAPSLNDPGRAPDRARSYAIVFYCSNIYNFVGAHIRRRITPVYITI